MHIMTLYTLLAALNLASACGIMLLRSTEAARLLWFISPVLWSMQLVCHLIHAGPYSLSGVAPTCTIAAVILGLCQCVSLAGDQGSGRPLFSGLFLFLLAQANLVPDSVRHDSFMMAYIFAILFFLSRPLSLGFTLYALSGMAHLLGNGGTDTRIRRTSKDAAFMASIIFLGGEIVGCYWGFMGWGTTWRWSGNFIFSAMLFVLFMVSLHVPPKTFRTRRSHDIAFSLPLLVVALCLVLTKVIS